MNRSLLHVVTMVLQTNIVNTIRNPAMERNSVQRGSSLAIKSIFQIYTNYIILCLSLIFCISPNSSFKQTEGIYTLHNYIDNYVFHILSESSIPYMYNSTQTVPIPKTHILEVGLQWLVLMRNIFVCSLERLFVLICWQDLLSLGVRSCK